MNNNILKLLKIKDENIKIINVEENVEVKNGKLATTIHAVLTYKPKACQRCGVVNEGQIQKHGKKESRITLPKMSECDTYLFLLKQRFKCNNCSKTFVAMTNIVNENCFISNRSYDAIIHKLTSVRSEKSISESCAVSPSTVHRHIFKVGETFQMNSDTKLPRHIAMDEFKSVKNSEGSMSFLFIDADTHNVIDIVENRQMRNLKAYFSRYSLKERKKVKTVSIDMYEPYMHLILEVFPNARIIIDRYHIVQAANRELNRYRIQLMNSMRHSDGKTYRKLKRFWKLFLMNPDFLNAFHYKRFPLFKSLMTSNGILEFLLNLDPKLRETYKVVHQLRYALKINDLKSFNDIVNNVEKRDISAGLYRIVRTFKKYQQYISNTFEYKHYTNGPIEGINNKIKLIKRTSYGYTNFVKLKYRTLIIFRLYKRTGALDDTYKTA